MKEEEFELRETKKEPSLGKALEAFRACEEMTQEELGDKVGITANLIDLMEKDKIIPSFDMLKCIATALDYGIDLFTPHYLESLSLTSLEVTTHYNAPTPTREATKATKVTKINLGDVKCPKCGCNDNLYRGLLLENGTTHAVCRDCWHTWYEKWREE